MSQSNSAESATSLRSSSDVAVLVIDLCVYFVSAIVESFNHRYHSHWRLSFERSLYKRSLLHSLLCQRARREKGKQIRLLLDHIHPNKRKYVVEQFSKYTKEECQPFCHIPNNITVYEAERGKEKEG